MKRSCLFLLLSLLPAHARAYELELKEYLETPFRWGMKVYGEVVSPAKGTRCAMAPSCSAYSRQAVKKHGLVAGYFLTMDRLHRCGHDLRTYPAIAAADGLRFRDAPP